MQIIKIVYESIPRAKNLYDGHEFEMSVEFHQTCWQYFRYYWYHWYPHDYILVDPHLLMRGDVRKCNYIYIYILICHFGLLGTVKNATHLLHPFCPKKHLTKCNLHSGGLPLLDDVDRKLRAQSFRGIHEVAVAASQNWRTRPHVFFFLFPCLLSESCLILQNQYPHHTFWMSRTPEF